MSRNKKPVQVSDDCHGRLGVLVERKKMAGFNTSRGREVEKALDSYLAKEEKRLQKTA